MHFPKLCIFYSSNDMLEGFKSLTLEELFPVILKIEVRESVQ